MAKKKTVSKTSPKGGKKGCLCEDGSYSSECCDGTIQAQGLGSEVSQGSSNVQHTNGTRVNSHVRG